eukprot:Awhi_evm1s1164
MSLTFNGTQWEWGDEKIIKYDQIYSQYPQLDFLYPFQIEKDWNGYIYSDLCADTIDIAMYICLVYFIAIFAGQFIMEKLGLNFSRQLRSTLALWNLGLSLFSAMGALRVAPHLINNILTHGYQWSVCTRASTAYGLGASGMWTTLFIFSKIPELFDTAFIVLRRSKLIFLHWYHHITVLLFCWHAYATRSSSGWLPRWVNPIWITCFQLSQMAVGIFVCVSVFYFQSIGEPCHVKQENLVAAGLMYSSYFALFLKFMLE